MISISREGRPKYVLLKRCRETRGGKQKTRGLPFPARLAQPPRRDGEQERGRGPGAGPGRDALGRRLG